MLRFEEYGKQYPDLVYDIFTFYINSNVKSIFAKDMIGINPDIGYKCPIDFLNKYSKKYSDLGTSYAVILPKTIKKICGILCENQLLYSLKLAYFNDVNDEMIFFTHSKILILLIKFFSKIC